MRHRKGRLRSGWKSGVITVFFTLMSVLLMSVFFMLIESVRLQGARAQTANIVDMANLSVFGEFEQKLLQDFEVFAVDGAFGSGDFHIDRVRDRLTEYMEMNASPASDGLTSMFFDPWRVDLGESKITDYALLSDGQGENFYQQAVAYMRETVLMQSTGKLMQIYRDSRKVKKGQETYEQEKNNSDKEMEELKKQEEAKKAEEKQKESENAASNLPAETESAVETPKIKNPLPALAKLARRDILSVVCGDAQIFTGSTGFWELPSRRRLQKGNWTYKRPYGGIIDDLLFREYLLSKLPNWSKPAEKGELHYGLEYVIGGRRRDRDNLKNTVRKLLLVREGCNYMYAVQDEEMSAQTGSMALGVIGWLGVPELTAVLKHALLLGWSYAESILDVRTLMKGGKVPLFKSAGDWEVHLENLADINEMLQDGRREHEKGSDYLEHLRILLNMQGIGTQKKRMLDMAELYVKAGEGLSAFKIDHCIVAIKDETSFLLPPLFSRVSGVWMGIIGQDVQVKVKGGYAY